MNTKRNSLEFHIPGSPNDAFFSQVALFSLGLKKLGPPYSTARIVFSVGSEKHPEIPKRWKPFLNDVEVRPVPVKEYEEHALFAQIDARFRNINPSSDTVIFCDADTFVVRRVDDLIHDIRTRGGINGVIAYWPLPHKRDRPSSTVWSQLAEVCGLPPPPMSHRYSLMDEKTKHEFAACPFYLNFGFVAGRANAFCAIADDYINFRRKLTRVLEMPYFAGQVALTFALVKSGVPARALPMRYNFPNEPNVGAAMPAELDDVRVIHYGTTTHFNRSTFLTTAEHFDAFRNLRLHGSSGLLQSAVLGLANGEYPFHETRRTLARNALSAIFTPWKQLHNRRRSRFPAN